MKKIITILGALTVASTPTITFKNIAFHKTQNLDNVIKTASNGDYNFINVLVDTRYEFKFYAHLTNSDYNGFSGFLDQISFSLSDYDYHAWPLYLFQWLDDDDFHSGPMPGLNSHTKHGFWHRPLIYAQRLETVMGHFGSLWDDKSDTAFSMSSSYGLWGTFGQTVDNQWNADRAASKPLTGIELHFEFIYDEPVSKYGTYPPSFQILMS